MNAIVSDPDTTDASRFWPVCSTNIDTFAPGPGGNRPQAACPSCGALERHRFLVMLLRQLKAWISGPGRVLEVAPTEPFRRFLLSIAGSRSTSIDIASMISPDMLTDLTRLRFADEPFDLIVCYHVLEHSPQDYVAIGELARTLTAKGLAVIQVPYSLTTATEELLDGSSEELEARFGRYDHVRLDGNDSTRRLFDAGLICSLIRPSDVFDEETTRRFGLIPYESSWICHSTDQAFDPSASLVEGESIEGELLRTQVMLAEAHQRGTASEARYQALASHSVAAAGRVINRQLKQLVPRE